jgi:hypothetical protein
MLRLPYRKVSLNIKYDINSRDGIAIGDGGQFAKPRRTHFEQVFFSFDCPRTVFHSVGPGAWASFQLHHAASCHVTWHLPTFFTYP